MTTPAKRHKLRVLAELAALAAGPGDEVRGSAYELMLAQLAEHKRTLKTIQSTERKIEAKRKMLPDFEDYVTGALEGGQGAHDMVLTTVLLDEAADAALKGQMDGNVLGILSEIFVLTQNHDAPDQARAKFYKAIGYAHMGKTDAHDPDITALPLPAAEEAMDFLQAAYRLHAGVGVKKDMERLERRLKAATPGTD